MFNTIPWPKWFGRKPTEGNTTMDNQNNDGAGGQAATAAAAAAPAAAVENTRPGYVEEGEEVVVALRAKGLALVTDLHQLLTRIEEAAGKDLSGAKSAALHVGEALHLSAEDGTEKAARPV